VVVPGKQHLIGVDGVDDVEAHNNYEEMHLFSDFSRKISVVEPTKKHNATGKKRWQGKICYDGS